MPSFGATTIEYKAVAVCQANTLIYHLIVKSEFSSVGT